MFKNNVGRPPVKYDNILAISIREAREKLGDTQDGFAEKLGVNSGRTVWNWENAKSNPSKKMRKKIEELCGYELKDSKSMMVPRKANPEMVNAIREYYEEREYLPLLLERMGHDLSDHILKFRKFEEYLLGSINHAIKNSDLSFEDFMAEQVKSSIELYNILHKKG